MNMASPTGISYRLNRYADPTWYALGGTILNARPRLETVEISEAGSEQRRLVTKETVEVNPIIDWRMNIRRLEDYITTYAILTAEGAIPSHILRFYDGQDEHEFTGVRVNSCRISIRQRESIKAIVQALCANWVAGTWGTGTTPFQNRTDPAIYKTALTTLSVGGVDVLTQWRSVDFTVNNNVMQDHSGTGLMPTDVFEQEAAYEATIILPRKQASLFAAIKAGTKKTFIMALVDRQSSPVTKTFTLTDALVNRSVIQDRVLGVITEAIVLKGDQLTVA